MRLPERWKISVSQKKATGDILGHQSPGQASRVLHHKRIKNGNGACALLLQPKSFLGQNIYQNIIKYCLVFPSILDIDSFLLKIPSSRR